MRTRTAHRTRTALSGRTAVPALGALLAGALMVTGAPAGVAAPDRAVAAGPSAESSAGPLARAFERSAAEYGVPRDLLVAVAHGESRLDDHGGRPSQANGYGVMHLVSNPDHRTLERAAALTGLSPARLREDTAANIRGGAAVLRALADEQGLDAADRRDAGAWYEAVAAYGGAEDDAAARLYADAVYDFLGQGLTARTRSGETLRVAPRAVEPDRGRLERAAGDDFGVESTDYAPALWVPADASNYTVGRTSAITHVVVHVTQGSYAGSISWYQNPSSDVSAHYTIRSSDGQVTQSVREKDTAWHARSGNPYSVGIEHEGYVSDPAWFTDAMYRSSAALTRHLADRYGIPKDRAHIVGHVEVPGNDHTDPGPYWDWSYYMQLVGGSNSGGEVRLTFPAYTSVSTGSTGDLVRAAQHLLNQQGHGAGTVDGIFGSGTATAVKSFQTAKGLTADGVVGRRTWTALLTAGTTPVLQQGSTGAAVERLQRGLTAALGRTVDADGVFGPGTATAVREYQTGRGLTADGIVGSGTWGALQAGR
ncbi:N-acetyl-anhydromuramyl-L-alanine amidase AmpD [Streptomyces sp. MJP52]|nr:N-acetyl-anhydromuramyl-L-alanine amidase AmpD [Streptomyces sp. MJP52]